MTNYDAIIIGGGHNGLVCAAYLARVGRRVLVLERREVVGGTAVTEELFPGFRFSTLADGAGYLSPKVVRDLNLAAHGLELLPVDLVALALQPDGRHLPIWQDVTKTAAEIAHFSPQDAARYPEFVALMQQIAGVVAGLMHITPLDLPAVGLGDLRQLLPLNGPLRRLGRKKISHLLRTLPMSAADLLNEWFESDALKGTIAASSVRDITWGPMEAGTAYTLLYKWAGSNAGLFRSAGQVRGGMGALTQALARAAQSFGAEIRMGAEVTAVTQANGHVTGVTLASGETVGADVVVSAVDPRTTFLKLVGPRYLPATFLRHVANIKYRGSTARLHLALRDVPTFSGVSDQNLLRGAIQIAPDMNYLQRAYDPVKYGEFSARPYLDIRIPTLVDPTLAADGRHAMSITIKYAPYHLRSTTWAEQKEAFTQVILDALAAYSPDLQKLILHQRLLTPADLEMEYSLPEGNLNHGEMTLDQFFHMRPIPGWAQYRTPLFGLFLCGAGSHPGGGITGLPGHNAAREILAG
jgi:phytoene dehydrogenase-like protein